MTNRALRSGCVVSQSLVAMESQLTHRRAFPTELDALRQPLA